MGIAWVTFDSNSKTATGSSRIFVGVANMGSDNVFASEDNGATWSAVAGQRNDFIPHHGRHWLWLIFFFEIAQVLVFAVQVSFHPRTIFCTYPTQMASVPGMELPVMS